MGNNFKKQLAVRKSEFKMVFIIQIICFFFGMGLFFFLNWKTVLENQFEMGALISLTAVSFAAGIVQLSSYGSNFNMAVGMSKSRKFVLINYTLCSFLLIIQIVVGTLIFSLIEKIIYQLIFPTGTFRFLMLSEITFSMACIYIVAMVIVPIFMGLLILRYGARGFWVLWALWVFGTTGISNLIGRVNEILDKNASDFLASMRWTHITVYEIFCTIVLILLFFASIQMIKKQEVTV